MKKKVLIATTDIRVFTSELVRLGKLGAEFTSECVAIKGLPLMRATVIVGADVDVGQSPILTVFGAESKEKVSEDKSTEKVEMESVEEKPVTEKKTTRAPRTTKATGK